MPRKKKIEVEVQEEEVVEQVEQSNVVQHTDRWDSGTNHQVSESLPSLDD